MEKERALEELLYIKQIINDSKKVIAENGTGFIVWGIIVAFGLLSTYLFVAFKIPMRIPWNWVVLILIGWIYSFIDYKRSERKKVYSLSSKILGSIWMSTGVALTILGFVGVMTGAIHSHYICPVFSTIIGSAVLITSSLYEHKWIKYIAYVWWISAIFMFLLPGLYTLLLMAAEILLLQVVPGYLLSKEYKKTQAELL
ncbi:MAG: hypothetical protein JEY94_12635 [Melioribacteraceae bacterium]|nr:hypothetical protein [Melioribacteraceae bacterium]